MVTALPLVAAPAAQAEPACDAFTPPTVDTGVPTARDVLGFDLGQREVTAAEADTYLHAVSDASPNVVDGQLATSTQGRPLDYAVVGQPKWTNPAALKAIGHNLNLLRDPETPEPLAQQLVRDTPSVLWVAGNVHGDEESGTDVSLRVLYELAARTDCTAPSILDDAIVVVLPTQNPDGHEADTRQSAAGFDLNRDWFARTQPETDGKLDKLRELPPQLYVDSHEMGSDDYFFPPNADPVYHDIGEAPLNWVYGLYGPAMQRSFDRFGIPYFNGSSYDLMYMGYGDTVPLTGFNAAGMTFEKNNADPIADRVREQYTAIWTTLMTAGAQNAQLREQWRAEHVEAQRQGQRGELEPNELRWQDGEITNPVPDIAVKHYFLRTDDPAKAEGVQRLARRLQRMDVDVHRLAAPLTVPDYTPYGRPQGETTLPAGTLWVPMAQGQKHWVQAMLNESSYVPFPYFYDVTAWSGPLLENVDGGRSGADLHPAAAPLPPQPEPAPPAPRGERTAVYQISATDSSSVESAGWLRHWLGEQRLDFGDLTARQIADGALEGYRTLVIPNGSDEEAAQALGPLGQAALADWVRGGGTLIGLRDGSRLATRLGLTSATYAEPTSDIPGALIRTETTPGSPLAEGVGDTAWAMYEYDAVWSAPPEASAVRFPAAGDPDWYVSGFASGAEELQGKTAVVDENVGSGRVVLFGFDPNYRAFTNGTARFLRTALTGPEPATAATTRVAPHQVPAPSAAGRMVLTVHPDAAERVRALLGARSAAFDEVRAGDGVRFLVDLGGRGADEHPWARSVADQVAALGRSVVAIRLP
ncbi:M14 family zinc carboxypeptidase [Saccharopolyspora mangrovi]|uniref:M14 family zinc carboxypeptidase n=1 Tax=Saccharopolyspora mangrovi TaxID=3082379 RepID=A0ABU6AFX7_9PSEU|nr:M14 family zinc carboxypeptidase [Saccharopolyspora sp. S2-29]MEB3370400.1 M14 family zinc carboxypeptidase [Saccharopolyspora sp. S2-29]